MIPLPVTDFSAIKAPATPPTFAFPETSPAFEEASTSILTDLIPPAMPPTKEEDGAETDSSFRQLTIRIISPSGVFLPAALPTIPPIYCPAASLETVP